MFLAIATLALLGSQRLYLARVCRLRSVEAQRLLRCAALAGLIAVALGRATDVSVAPRQALLGACLSFLFLYAIRGGFRSFLNAQRRQGRYRWPVVVIGANREGQGLCRLLADNAELGLHVVGVVGCPTDMATSIVTVPYLGDIAGTEAAVERSGATGVLVAATAVGADELNRLTRALVARGIHVQLSSGLQGIAHGRLRTESMAYEPFIYVEPVRRVAWHGVAKRSMDLIVGTLGFLLALPVIAVAALAIKLDDGGPILFRQARVGMGGRKFTILKLRTMVPDAELRYEKLAAVLSGPVGPLVKLENDPRITRVGRILRAASVDELPQFLNVVGGSMSLVGPRPMLCSAVPDDDAFLLQRASVRPGITGLYQLEARDNPSFDVYRRLDLYYLENWSIGLDCGIFVATVAKTLARGAKLLLPRPRLSCPVVLATAPPVD